MGKFIKRPKRTKALLIGPQSYGPEFKALRCPANDVACIAEVLKSWLGWDPEDIVELRQKSAHGSATSVDTLTQLAKLTEETLRPEDTVLICFTGHGFRRDEELLFVLEDAMLQPWDQGRSRCVSLEQILAILDHENIRSAQRIVWLDYCRTQWAPRPKGLDTDLSTRLEKAIKGGIRATKPGPCVVLFSCAEEQFAYEDHERLGSSLFIKALLEVLKAESKGASGLSHDLFAHYLKAKLNSLIEQLNWTDIKQEPKFMPVEPGEITIPVFRQSQTKDHFFRNKAGKVRLVASKETPGVYFANHGDPNRMIALLHIPHGKYGIGFPLHPETRPMIHNFISGFFIEIMPVLGMEAIQHVFGGNHESWLKLQSSKQSTNFRRIVDLKDCLFRGAQDNHPIHSFDYYEARSLAEDSGLRLPFEFELEIALVEAFDNASALPVGFPTFQQIHSDRLVRKLIEERLGATTTSNLRYAASGCVTFNHHECFEWTTSRYTSSYTGELGRVEWQIEVPDLLKLSEGTVAVAIRKSGPAVSEYRRSRSPQESSQVLIFRRAVSERDVEIEPG